MGFQGFQGDFRGISNILGGAVGIFFVDMNLTMGF
jgi:hypothetical protein